MVTANEKIPFINNKTIIFVPAAKFKLYKLDWESGNPVVENLVFRNNTKFKINIYLYLYIQI